jgi:hypothetical protein
MKRNSMTIWFAGYVFFSLMLAIEQASKAQDASEQPREIWHLRQPPTAAPGFYVVSSSANGQLLAARDRDNVVFIFDLERQKKWFEFKGHETNWIESIEFSPEGQRFLTAAGSGEKLKVWRTDNGQLEFEIPTTTSRAGFSIDGAQIIALGSSKVEYFGVPSGLVQGVSNWQLGNEAAVAMSRDGKLVVMHRQLNPQVYSLELLNLQSKLRIGLPGDTARPTQIIVSPDKQWIAGSFENGNRLHLWHSSNPRDRHYVLDGHDGIIGAIAFSSDGRFLVSADDQRKVIAWDILTRQSVSKFETGQSAIRSMAFLPQPFRVAIGGITDSESSIWIGDLRPVILKSPQACPESMDLIWKQLGSTTASTSLDAASALIEHFEKFQVELRETLFAATYERSVEELNNLLLQLSDENFLRREQATRQLVERLSHFEVQLRQLFKNEDLPTEQRYRIRRILINQPRTPRINVEIVRRWMRLILVLEMVGSSESRQLLERIAVGHPDNEISGSASAALQRFDTASRVSPD